ncbi:hypothetical protein BGZ94_000657 [Podila epigama]|nr:hypothetical protein BGZ94_000657 [Podila epigama]
MTRLHQYYSDHLVAIHSNLRRELKTILRGIPNTHLQGHHDLEEAVIFPAFAAATDITHWSHSHEELENTLAKVRTLAQQGIDQDGKNFDAQKPTLIEELENLSDIVLPHLRDEEIMSTPEETLKLWPTEAALRRAFPWLR